MPTTIRLSGNYMWPVVDAEPGDWVSVRWLKQNLYGQIVSITGPNGVMVQLEGYGPLYFDFADIDPLTQEELETVG